LSQLPVEVVVGDIADGPTLTAAMDGCRRVFHVAALLPGSTRSEGAFARINVEGTRNVLEAAVAAGVERLLHVSTVNVFGPRPGAVLDETSTSKRPLHRGYDQSKSTAEALVREYAAGPLDAVIVNPSVMFGPRSRQSGQLIESFLTGRLRVIPDPKRPLSIISALDVARGCIKAMERGRRGERYILSNPPITVREFLRVLGKVACVPPPRLSLPRWTVAAAVAAAWAISPVTRRPPPVTVKGIWYGGTMYDTSRSANEIGMTYTPLEEALAATVQWLRDVGRVASTEGQER
jgi:dihydroflavonol-4-reductase